MPSFMHEDAWLGQQNAEFVQFTTTGPWLRLPSWYMLTKEAFMWSGSRSSYSGSGVSATCMLPPGGTITDPVGEMLYGLGHVPYGAAHRPWKRLSGVRFSCTITMMC